jgi:hypothetical protein
MKTWLRQHPDTLPDGLDATEGTSHELRRGLEKMGWRLVELADRFLVIQPDPEGDTSFAQQVINEEAEDDASSADEEIDAAQEITFGLERDLQATLRLHIEQLEPGLRLADGGRELATEAGRIDITANDAEGRIVVIELKAGIAQPAIIAQVLAYMATVENPRSKPVRGIIVAGDFNPRVVLASRAIPNLELRRYAIQFAFRPID